MNGKFYVAQWTPALFEWNQESGPFDSLEEAFKSKESLDRWNSPRLLKPPRLVVIQIHEKP
jgi:hypothetical protein